MRIQIVSIICNNYQHSEINSQRNMSSFKAKASLIKSKIQQENINTNQNHNCSHQQLRIIRQKTNDNLCNTETLIQQPIIIQKRTVTKAESQKKKKNPQKQPLNDKKYIQPFVPVVVPTRDKKISVEMLEQKSNTRCGNKEIEIQIEKDDKNKDCLKKLFKKIHKLSQDLQQSESQRIRLKFQLDNYKNRQNSSNDYEKKLNKLQCQKYKLQVQLDMLRKLLKDRDSQIERHKLIVPKQIIKQVIIEKPVEVIVQVFKPVPGPQRIVEKIVQVPKYIQVEKKVPVQIIKQMPREVIRHIEVPTVIQKPVYIDRPIYLDRPMQYQRKVQVPIQVPVQVPIYVDRPVVQDQWLHRIRQLEQEIEHLLRDNNELVHQNNELRIIIDQLSSNIQVLRRHNQQKNRQVQHLLQNSIDYQPYSPSQDYSIGSVKYTISSNNHPRVI